jgi:type 1 glutamine amidotransferase
MFSRIERVVAAGVIAICLPVANPSGRAFADDHRARPASDALRVLIVTGRGDHDWRATVPFLRLILTDTGCFDVRVCEAPAGLTAGTLAGFDVLVDDCGASASDSDTGKAIAGFVESGKGLVVTHGALSFFKSMHANSGDNHQTRSGSSGTVPGYWPAFPSGGSPPAVQFLEVKIAQPDHPIVQGIKSRFKIADAVYRGMTVRPKANVIATILAGAESGRDKDEPALIVSGHGLGRVFSSALGHDLAAMQETEFITTFARGTEWAATGKVTLPPELGLPHPSASAVRGLLITGGHDHETAFYTLFEGHKDLAWLPVASSTTAFASDLRSRYDVLIMYDFSHDLDEKGKKNLREFVESGKGIVVLHHALLNYQEWPWWYEEVVGGRYRLKSEGGVPSSTVKDGQQIFVTPAGAHPITAGIGPFHIVDETYKGMWISPRVKPLLTTDNPNSDRSLAWIGPCASSRVVAIQLGHGHTAFGHPTYRALVHNAILWSAGRIK